MLDASIFYTCPTANLANKHACTERTISIYTHHSEKLVVYYL